MTARARLAVAAAIAVGIALGLGAFTFGYARGYSYLTNDPAACANCHVMTEHFGAWNRSSHRAVAVCNDCHTPSHPVNKYVVKAQNGFWHSFYFTTGNFPDPLRITPRNRKVTEAACRGCHEQIVDAIDAHSHEQRPGSDTEAGELQLSCIRCHAHVGHFVR
jgi:cytochrome c nitrite reductase small subunit